MPESDAGSRVGDVAHTESLVSNDLLCFLHSYSSIFPIDKLRLCIMNEFSKESLSQALSMINTVLAHEDASVPNSKSDILDEVMRGHERVEELRVAGNTVPVFVSRDLRSIPFDIQHSPSLSGHVLNRILQELQSLKNMIVSNLQPSPVTHTVPPNDHRTPRPNLSLTVDCSSDNAVPALNNSGNSGTSSEISPTKVAAGSPESPGEGLLGIRGSMRKRGVSSNLESAVERIKQRKVSPAQTVADRPNQLNPSKSATVEFACKAGNPPTNSTSRSKSSPVKNSLPTAALPNINAHVNGLFNDNSQHPDWVYHQQQQWYHAYVNSLQNIQLMMAQKHNTSPRAINPNLNPLSGLSLLPSTPVPVTQAMHSPPGSVWPSFSSSGWSESTIPNGRSSKISPNNTATATSSLSGGDVASSVAGHSIKEEPDADMEDDSPELDDDLDDFNQEYKPNSLKCDDDPVGSPGSDTVESNAGSTKGGKGIGNRNSKLLNDAIDKPHECPYPNCTKRFANKFLWKKHVFIHTGERPYECHHCHKKFNRKDNLLRHKKTHNMVSYGQGRRRPLGETSGGDNGDMSLLATSPYSFQPAMAHLLAAAAAATSQSEPGPENNSLVGLLRSNVPTNVEM